MFTPPPPTSQSGSCGRKRDVEGETRRAHVVWREFARERRSWVGKKMKHERFALFCASVVLFLCRLCARRGRNKKREKGRDGDREKTRGMPSAFVGRFGRINFEKPVRCFPDTFLVVFRTLFLLLFCFVTLSDGPDGPFFRV